MNTLEQEKPLIVAPIDMCEWQQVQANKSRPSKKVRKLIKRARQVRNRVYN